MKYQNLGNMLSIQAEHYGKKALVYFNKDVHTYSEVDSVTNQGARLLAKLGIKKGDRVAILMENSPYYFYSLYSIFKAGATAVPINNMLRDTEITYILNDSEAKLLIMSEKYAEMFTYFNTQGKYITDILSWGETSFTSKNIFNEVKSISNSNYPSTTSLDDIALFIYTSGTTGHPKGAMLTHGNILADALYIDDLLKLSPTDKFLLFLPMFHSYTLMVCILFPVYLGCSVIVLESVMELKSKKFRDILLFKRPRIMLGVPQVYQALTKAPMPKWFIKLFYPVRLHISGGAPISEETLRAFKDKFGVPVYEGYGLSEASPVVSFNSYELQKAGTVGQVLPGIKAKIVDDEDKELPIGEIGELILKGGNIMKGYWKMPKATDDAIKNGWLFTGDFAKIDEDNFITIVDRKKDLILTKGMNVYPREIEDVIKQIDAVEAVAVIGIPNESKDETIIAYVKPFEGAEVTVKEIKEYLKNNVASFKTPKQIYIMDQLPLTATGKVLKRELKRQVLAGELKID